MEVIVYYNKNNNLNARKNNYKFININFQLKYINMKRMLRTKDKNGKKNGNDKNSNTTENPETKEELVTVSKIITEEGTQLPINSFQNSNQANEKQPKMEEGRTRLRGKKKEEKKIMIPKDEGDEEFVFPPKSKTVQSLNELIGLTPEESCKTTKIIDQIDDNEKQILRSNMNKFFKRANVVEGGTKLQKDNKGNIPSKDINPNELFVINEENKEINYLPAQKTYELNDLLNTHKFINNNNALDKKLSSLVKRQVIRFERNLDLIEDKKFFILYELQVSMHTHLSITDIGLLNAIKAVLLSYPSSHLIIMFSDEELYNNNPVGYDYSLIKEFAEEKLANILIYLNLGPNNENRLHAFSSKMFKTKNKEFEKEKSKLVPLLDKPKLRKLFNLTTKEQEKNSLLLNYPCYLAVATNPSIYSKYIPQITKDYRCLIMNSIFYMNRYQMCFDAAKILSFNEPAIMALKMVPTITGTNGTEAYLNFDEGNTLLSSDEAISLQEKIDKMPTSEGRNPNLDIACQYLGFLEEDNDNYYYIIKRFED